MPGEQHDDRTWSDDQLISAIAASHSWRGVMRELGLCVTSAGSIRVVKRHVQRLNLDTSHFTGQRRWSDAQLRRAVADAVSWDELISALGQESGQEAGRVVVRAHARRLGLDLSKIDPPDLTAGQAPFLQPHIRHLRSAAAAAAAMWFGLCGCNTSIPLEPDVYDLLVGMPTGMKRVQIKTTTYSKNGWEVKVGRRPYSVKNLGPLIPYDPDTLDYFFILDGELSMYLIPSVVVAGRTSILLRNYTRYVVGSAGSVLQAALPAG